jgi:hypothetical protein
MEAAFVAGAQQQEAEPEDFDFLVQLVFEEVQLQGRICDVARRKGLGETPWTLPIETQRAVVAAMIEEAGEAPHTVRPAPGKRRSWRFWEGWSFAPRWAWRPGAIFPEMPGAALASIEAVQE